MWWQRWSAEPGVVLSLAVAGGVYMRGAQSVWQRAGPGRGVRIWQALVFVAGLLALAFALLSPLDALGGELFWVHMVQHLVLILVAAPLLAAARPLPALFWALPCSWRHGVAHCWRDATTLREIAGGFSSMPVAWGLSAAVLWAWHMPWLYQAALRSEAVHALEHTCFFVTGLLFWWSALEPPQGRRGYGASVLALATMSVVSGVLGALLTFATTPWYPDYAASAPAWGLTPLEDQQLAGLVMWIPASVVYLGASAFLFVMWLAAIERTAARATERRMEHVREGGVQP